MHWKTKKNNFNKSFLYLGFLQNSETCSAFTLWWTK